MQTYKLSNEGLVKLENEMKELQEVKRPVAVKRLSDARAMGDLSENSEYTAAREDLNFIDGRIAEIDHIIRNAERITEEKDQSYVQIGDKVHVESNGDHDMYHIVGDFEADIASGKISDSSPIGKALIGAKLGEEVEVTIPAGTVKYKIMKIE